MGRRLAGAPARAWSRLISPWVARSIARSIAPLAALAAALLLGACAGAQQGPAPERGGLRLLGEQRLAWRQAFGDTVVGGLSGIDYDARSGTWVMVSDDRSVFSPARFYTATLDYGSHGFTGLRLEGVTLLRQPDGSLFPNRRQQAARGGEVPDFESIRIDPADGSLWIGSEGGCAVRENPALLHLARDGRTLSRFEGPAMFDLCRRAGTGTRDNLAFEGLTFARDGRSLWVSMEGPLWQDGPVPARGQGSVTRLTQFTRAGGVLRQVAYPLDALPDTPAEDPSAVNGVSEILAVDDDHLLTLERAAVRQPDGRYLMSLRLYELDLREASDIQALPALQGAAYRPVHKRLVLDLSELPLARLDNLEGMAWGPRVGDGCATLVLVSDDNFNPAQVTQLLAFDVLPASGLCRAGAPAAPR